MTTRKTALSAAMLTALIAGTSGLSVLPVHDAVAQQAQQGPREGFVPGRHVEGRIAFLKAELKITDAQAPLFERVAQAMRENANAMRQAVEQRRANRDQPSNALQRLEARSQFAALRAQASQRLLDAFKPLYASLSDEQKKTADELMASHHRRRA